MTPAQAISRLRSDLDHRVSVPGDPAYLTATAIWAHSERRPQAVVHCQSVADVQRALAAARAASLAISVRAGGHDWAGRALCDGLVLDLTAMQDVTIAEDARSVRVGGGPRAR